MFRPPHTPRPLALVGLLLVALVTGGCQSSLEWLGMKLIFDPAPWPAEQRIAGTYGTDDPERQRFELYLPDPATASGWPTLVFVHGGGWTEGSIDLEAAGQPIYGNIGGYYPRHGIGVALVEYRLQVVGDEPASPGSDPAIGWRDQVLDVAQAIAAVRRSVAEHGGDPSKLVFSGHSAGAQLATYAAVVDWPGEQVPELGEPCGVVAISGAGYDLDDDETYALGASRAYYQARFGAAAGWDTDASLIDFLDPNDPPFLVFYAGREYPSLQHQARHLDAALREQGIDTRLSVVPRQGHRRIVVTFSQGDHPMTDETVGFVEDVVERCD